MTKYILNLASYYSILQDSFFCDFIVDSLIPIILDPFLDNIAKCK